MPHDSGTSPPHLKFKPLQQNHIRAVLIAALIGVIAVTVFTRIGNLAEVIISKHYFNSVDRNISGFYYSGFSGLFFIEDDGLTPLHIETEELYIAANGFLKSVMRDESLTGTFQVGGYQSDRYFSSGFLPSLAARLGFGTIRTIDGFLIANLFVWCASIIAIFFLTKRFTREPHAPWIAAILLSCWPIYTLALDAIKMQFAGTSIFLIGICLHEYRISRLKPVSQFLYYVGFWFIASLASGGWAITLAYFLLRFICLYLTKPAERRALAIEIIAVVGAFIVAKIWIGVLLSLYGLKSSFSAREFSFSKMIGDSIGFLWAFVKGADISNHSFANLPGATFFTSAVPKIVAGFVGSNPILVGLGLIAFIMLPSTRWLLAMSPILLFINSGAVYIGSGKTGLVNYFGYFSGGAMAMIIIASAVLLGRRLEQSGGTKADTRRDRTCHIGYFLCRRLQISPQ